MNPSIKTKLFISVAVLLFLWSISSFAQVSETFHLGESRDSILNKMAFSKNYRLGLSGTTSDKTSTYIVYQPKDFPDGALAYMFHADNICWMLSLDRSIDELDYAKSAFKNDNYMYMGNNSWEAKNKLFRVQIPADKITSTSFTIIYVLITRP